MRFIVWIDQGKGWEEQGDGPMGEKTAERVAREIRADFKIPVRMLPEGQEPLLPSRKSC